MARRRIIGGSSGGHGDAGMMRWLLTYSDLITLLMVFFVVMYAMSKADTVKFNALKESLAVALQPDGAGASLILDHQGATLVDQGNQNASAPQSEEDFQKMINEIKAKSQEQNQMGFIVDERGLTIRFLDSSLFDLGSANLRPEAFKLLDAVGDSIKNNGRYVRVEGHTDDLPINTYQFPSNWELSAARSIAVTRYLIEKHRLDPRLLSSLGYGEYRPLYPNNAEANRAKNRRVDIVVLRTERAGGEISANSSIGPVTNSQ
ncbi:MAG: chemotaxis protein MotB [Firmicutes bacterium]|nr:chemotaxis protein MotB [Bacillota bacterium]